jgi:predicted DNA-binding transcriptional regulator YafY
MAKGPNQKLKLLYLAKIFMEQTDEDHGLTMAEILSGLSSYGVSAERKSIYDDLENLRTFGMDIVTDFTHGHHCYYLASRNFDLAELKMLVDCVQSARFLTTRKSQELIKKLESLTSSHQAKNLQRQVYITGRVKTMNTSVFYNVDAIQSAISANRQIRFQYFQWNEKKEMELRHAGAYYQVSPWSLLWDNEYYYLVAYDEKEDKIKHFRVDKMLRISQTAEARTGQKQYDSRDTAAYTRRMFGMFQGEVRKVTLEFENRMSGIVLDRFGQDILMMKQDETHTRTVVEVAVSNLFFGWIMSLGGGIRIVAPEDVVDGMREQIHRMEEIYL